MDKKKTLMKMLNSLIHQIPFNASLGLEFELSAEKITVKLPMKPQFVGNTLANALHGGVIASILDITGGALALEPLIDEIVELDKEEQMRRFSKFGTIDLRVDYLRRGQGEIFYCTGTILRTGSRVSVTRMEMVNEKDQLIAVGTGTYIHN